MCQPKVKKKKTSGNYWKEKRERGFSHENFPQMNKKRGFEKKVTKKEINLPHVDNNCRKISVGKRYRIKKSPRVA